MSKLYSNLLKLAQRVDPYTKAGKKILNYGSAVTITNVVDSADTFTVTATAHGFAVGDKVTIEEVTATSMTGLNNTAAVPYHAVATAADANTFTITVTGTGTGGTYTSGGKVTKYHVGAVDGDKFLAQRLLDIYNEARWALANGIMRYQSPYERSITLSGLITRRGTLTFTTGVAPKPSGFLEAIGDIYETVNATRIPIIPLQAEDQLRLLEGTYNPFVAESTSDFIAPSGITYIPDTLADTYAYVLSYYACTDWPLVDVFIPYTGTSYRDENLPAELEPLLIDIAVAIANQQGEQAIQSIIAASLGGKK